MFNGFPEETVRFFLDLRFHNDAAFFNENRERYRQDVQAPFYEFIEELAPLMQSIDPLMEVRPYKCLARIRRDTRFTKDKSPYRDHLWLCFRRMAEPRDESLNYFFEFGPGTLGWGLGFWARTGVRWICCAGRWLLSRSASLISLMIAGCRSIS